MRGDGRYLGDVGNLIRKGRCCERTIPKIIGWRNRAKLVFRCMCWALFSITLTSFRDAAAGYMDRKEYFGTKPSSE
ncbi:hypothetical protein OPQ81_001872 [Rhizoctonia solani]|nr:hypothetical protein OPQ81_001872 [Rhizoctonia solani]